MKKGIFTLALMLGVSTAFGAIGFDQAAKIAQDKTGAEIKGIVLAKDRAGEFYKVKSIKDDKFIEVQIDKNDGKIIDVKEFNKKDKNNRSNKKCDKNRAKDKVKQEQKQ
ncbi:hypothetical protein LMG7974_00706 [Campylobacter majalis]|uniref:PepSY domain-containing protein n=1 Tax=Campylobacter majalis TaxID=2790656 RepID=A0ABM8Q4K9_9BACT|nr:PepSY domain-containing protein [Campylobacter majalis]CAD7287818.1 hypothetical protein LMG7974_00706 [Campylobacter majalis]